MSGAVQVVAEVLGNREAGAYRCLDLAAPQVAATAGPGQFVALAVGDRPTAMLLRRSFSLFSATPASGDGEPGVIRIVVAAAGPGSDWVTRRRPGDLLDVIGPLGRTFPAAQGPAPVILVGGGYGAAPLVWWARQLTAAGRRVEVVLGAATRERLFGVEEAAAAGARVHVTTDDGSAGSPGRVTGVLPGLLARTGARDVYACGPMAMLRAVDEVTRQAGSRSWLAVEESMACGIGVCMTCVLPVRQADGLTRMTRSCVEGPTFAGETVRWDAIVLGGHAAAGLVPADCVGAPARTGGH